MGKLRYLLCCVMVLLAQAAQADLVLVTHPRSGIERLTQEEVINIYLGRYRRLASGLTAEPVDLSLESEVRARFYRHLVNKSAAEINAYWARLVFSGKTRPPMIIDTADGVMNFVSTHPGALAYLERAQVDGRVKVVFELGN